MLVALVASHLLAAQVAAFDTPPLEPAAADRLAQETNPPLPERPGAATPHEAPPPAAEPAPAAPRATLPPPSSTAPARPAAGVQRSLLSAEPLAGGAAMLAQAGWSSLGVQYAQGVSRTDDLGALAELDWATTELRLGGLWRRSIGTAGPWDLAFRLTAGWYANFGGEWVHGDNESDRGIEASPGVALSLRAAGGILSLLGETPITVTFRRDGGLLFRPRASVAYEAPLYGEFTVGVRAGLGWRGGSGGAPRSEGEGELTFLLVGGWRVY